jgi:two-component system CheB/CheR fusion protein
VEDALRASEETLRQEVRLVELSRAPIFVWDFDNGIIRWNRGSEELYGYGRDEAHGKRKDELLHTRVAGSTFGAVKAQLVRDGHWAGELLHTTKDGRSLTVESHIELANLAGRRLVFESTRDITERKLWEEQQQLLLRELAHRVKNTLAVVQSIARHTLQSSGVSEDFNQRLEGRLAALAHAHDLLISSNWHGAELSELIKGQLGPYIAENVNRVAFEGPKVTLSPNTATPLALILHELATNAIKHGALSGDKGTVKLSWTVDNTPEGRLLKAQWEEGGGPRVAKPRKTGFGTQLIENAMGGARIHCDYPATGVRCTMAIPI